MKSKNRKEKVYCNQCIHKEGSGEYGNPAYCTVKKFPEDNELERVYKYKCCHERNEKNNCKDFFKGGEE